jgi:hypothetical protein
METISVLSSLIILATVLFVGYSIFTFLRKLFSNEIRVTNRNTGKSVVLAKHPVKGQAQKLLEVIG